MALFVITVENIKIVQTKGYIFLALFVITVENKLKIVQTKGYIFLALFVITVENKLKIHSNITVNIVLEVVGCLIFIILHFPDK